MSKIKIKKHDFGVFGGVAYVDDLLPQSAFEALADFAVTVPKSPVPYTNPKSVWPENAPYNPLHSKPVIWPEDDTYTSLLKSFPDIDLFPTSSPVDEALRAIRDLVIDNELLGTPPLNWAGSLSSIYHYSPGHRLLWHNDSAGQVGAFNYYVHKQWDKNAGGQFLYKSGDQIEDFEGCFITPRPNRLVIVRSPLSHAVAPTLAAPGNDRMTLSGFFVSAEYAETLIKLHAPAQMS